MRAVPIDSFNPRRAALTYAAQISEESDRLTFVSVNDIVCALIYIGDKIQENGNKKVT